MYNVLIPNDPAITVTFTPDSAISNSLAQNRFAGFDGDGSVVTLSARNASDIPVLVRLYERGVLKGQGESDVGVAAQIAGFPTTNGTVYTIVITGGDAVGPATYTASVNLTSP